MNETNNDLQNITQKTQDWATFYSKYKHKKSNID